MSVAFLGLGAMGYPMAGRVAARFPTTVWNRTESVARRHSAEFATSAVPLSDVRRADIVVSCLAGAGVVSDVVERAVPDLRAGTLWVDCTSGRPDTSRLLARRLADVGVDYLDAPVSGMAQGARAGTLTAMVGGPAASLDRARAVLEAMCQRIVHVGDVGTGHLVKAANNALFAGGFWLAAEVFAALDAEGVDPTRALECMNASSGRSYVTERFLAEFVLPTPHPSSYRLGQSHRDVTTFVDATADRATGDALLRWLNDAYARLGRRIDADSDAAPSFDAIGAG